LNRVLPLLSVSNINAATFRVAERTVDAEDAIIAIAQGKPNLRDQYRAEPPPLSKSGSGGHRLTQQSANVDLPDGARKVGSPSTSYPFISPTNRHSPGRGHRSERLGK
jgi:hypothetical protein